MKISQRGWITDYLEDCEQQSGKRVGGLRFININVKISGKVPKIKLREKNFLNKNM